MSDRTRLNLTEQIPLLNDYSLVIVRDYDHPDRASYAEQIVNLCHKHGHSCFIAADTELATLLRADGVHIPRWCKVDANLLRYKRLYPVSTSVHSITEAHRANRLTTDIAIVSPLFATLSHPSQQGIGSYAFQKISSVLTMPCFAMGGVSYHKPLPVPVQLSSHGKAGISLLS